jgi:hypothetical protein
MDSSLTPAVSPDLGVVTEPVIGRSHVFLRAERRLPTERGFW